MNGVYMLSASVHPPYALHAAKKNLLAQFPRDDITNVWWAHAARWGGNAKTKKPPLRVRRAPLLDLLVAVHRVEHRLDRRVRVSDLFRDALRWYLRSPEFHPLKSVLREHILSVG